MAKVGTIFFQLEAVVTKNLQSGVRRREALQPKERHITAKPKAFFDHLKMVPRPKQATVGDLRSFKWIGKPARINTNIDQYRSPKAE